MPLWVTQPPAATDRYQYYVGHSTRSPTAADGVFNASIDAFAKLAAEDFGGPKPVEGHASTLPDNVRLSGVEQIQLLKIRSADDGLYEIYVLYRYPREALEAERTRQRTTKNAPPGKHAAPGRLKLVVDHSDALIIVNGYPLAVATAGEPLELEVPSGEYVDAEFTQYETIHAVRKFFIPPGKAEIRDVKLVVRPGFLFVSTFPDDAVVDTDDGATVHLPATEHLRLSPGKHELTFRKAGYESQTVKVTIERDRTATLPKVTLVSAAEKLKRLADPPWVLEIAPLGNHAGTTAFPKVGAYTYGASLDRRISGGVRLRVGYFRGSGQNSIADPNAEFGPPIVTDTISGTYLEIGLPIEAYSLGPLQTFYLEPLWVLATQQIGGQNVNAQISQQGAGAAVSFRQYFEPGEDSIAIVGFGARAALTDYYSTGGGLSGKLALSICFVELLIGI